MYLNNFWYLLKMSCADYKWMSSIKSWGIIYTYAVYFINLFQKPSYLSWASPSPNPPFIRFIFYNYFLYNIFLSSSYFFFFIYSYCLIYSSLFRFYTIYWNYFFKCSGPCKRLTTNTLLFFTFFCKAASYRLILALFLNDSS
jgi:hypothetical protein